LAQHALLRRGMIALASSTSTVSVASELEPGPDLKTPRKTASARFRKLLVGSLILLILMIPFTAAFDQPGVRMDEGSVLVYPELIRHGALPYLDFETFYGPANIYVLAAAYCVFGTDVTVERSVGFVYRVLILALIFACLSRWNIAIAGGCTLLTASLLLMTRVIAFAWFGGVLCLLAGIWVIAEARSNTRYFVAGLIIGCALLYRVDLGPAALISMLPFLWGADARHRLSFIIATAISLLPLALFVCCVGPRALVENLFLYPVVYTSPARHIPMSAVEPYVRTLFLMHLFAAAINITAAFIFARANPGKVRSRLLLSLALLGAALTTQAAQRLDFFHLISAAFFTLGTLPLSLLVLTNRCRESPLRPAYAALPTIVVFAAVQTVLPTLFPFVKNHYVAAFTGNGDDENLARHAGRYFPRASKEEAIGLSRMLDWLERESLPGERLFVGPTDLRRTPWCDTFIYHLMPKLRTNTYFLEMNPLSTNRPNSRLAADIASSDWLVLDREIDSWREPNRSIEFQSDAPNEVVRDKFQLVNKFGPYLIFRRRI
jgi:hypothetical protein